MAPPQPDRNFDDLADVFESNIYGTAKGQLRLDIVREDLEAHIPEIFNPLASRRYLVVDAAGGIGQLSATLAAAGHRIVLCDISKVMIEKAQAEFAREAPDADVQFVNCAVQDLPSLMPQLVGASDLILFHAVIEWLQHPRDALRQIGTLLRPPSLEADGGHLSCLFYNRSSIVWRHLMNGSFDSAVEAAGLAEVTSQCPTQQRHSKRRSKKKKIRLTPHNPQDAVDVYEWITRDLGCRVCEWSGIRAIHDHMPPNIRERADYAELLSAERCWGRRPPFRDLARYVHILAASSSNSNSSSSSNSNSSAEASRTSTRADRCKSDSKAVVRSVGFLKTPSRGKPPSSKLNMLRRLTMLVLCVGVWLRR